MWFTPKLLLEMNRQQKEKTNQLNERVFNNKNSFVVVCRVDRREKKKNGGEHENLK